MKRFFVSTVPWYCARCDTALGGWVKVNLLGEKIGWCLTCQRHVKPRNTRLKLRPVFAAAGILATPFVAFYSDLIRGWLT